MAVFVAVDSYRYMLLVVAQSVVVCRASSITLWHIDLVENIHKLRIFVQDHFVSWTSWQCRLWFTEFQLLK